MRQSPGTLLHSFSNVETTEAVMAELSNTISTEAPITLMFGPTDQNSMPLVYDADDGVGPTYNYSININNSKSARFVQYYGWNG
jgi:hypothetical protein